MKNNVGNMFGARNNNPKDKRYAIMVAATDVFASNGYHNAKMEDIAQQIGIGKSTIYEYFSSKEDLFITVCKEGSEYYISVLGDMLEKCDNPLEKLEVFVNKQQDFISCHQNLATIFVTDAFIVNMELIEISDGFIYKNIVMMRKIIEEGIEKGIFRSVNVSIVAELIISSMLFITRYKLFNTSLKEDLVLDREKYLDIILNSIKN